MARAEQFIAFFCVFNIYARFEIFVLSQLWILFFGSSWKWHTLQEKWRKKSKMYRNKSIENKMAQREQTTKRERESANNCSDMTWKSTLTNFQFMDLSINRSNVENQFQLGKNETRIINRCWYAKSKSFTFRSLIHRLQSFFFVRFFPPNDIHISIFWIFVPQIE